jgi:hypothetical protein
MISDRNIFDTTRSPRGASSRGEVQRPPRSETLTLVGTLSSEKGSYAFFDGSSSGFRKVVAAGNTIAGLKVAEIDGNAVKLLVETNQMQLWVGDQLRKEEGGLWQITGGRTGQLKANDLAVSNSAGSDSGGDESDIIKKLMQQREQELK